MADRPLASMPASVNGTGPHVPDAFPWRRALAAVGMVILLFGAANVWSVSSGMALIEQQEGYPNGSVLLRLLPSIVANPAKYLGGTGTSGFSFSDGFVADRYLQDKRSLERWMALATAGLACFLFAYVTPGAAGSGREGASLRSSIGNDLAPVATLVAVAYLAFSFLDVG